MNKLLLLASVLMHGLLGISQAQAQSPQPVNSAAVASMHNDWLNRHESFNAVARKGGIELLFVGDSITEGWRRNGLAIWTERYAARKAANFGISGDRTEHLLWRLQNGNLDGISPKVAVVMIGTNNTWRNTPKQIAEGIAAVVDETRLRSPNTKVLLLGVFPRGEEANTPTRKKIAEINALLAKLDDDRNVFFIDIGQRFLIEGGTLPKDVMPDGLHLSATGYQIWADAMEPKLAVLLK